MVGAFVSSRITSPASATEGSPDRSGLRLLLQPRTGAGSDVKSLSVSEDGKLVALGITGGLVRLFDMRTGRVVREYHSGGDTPIDTTFLDGDRSLMIADAGAKYRTIRILDIETGKVLRTFNVSNVLSARLSHDRKQLITTRELEGEYVEVLDAKSGIITGHTLDVDPGDKFELVDGKDQILIDNMIYDIRTLEGIKDILSSEKTDKGVGGSCFSRPGSRIAALHLGRLIIYDLKSDKIVHRTPIEKDANHIFCVKRKGWVGYIAGGEVSLRDEATTKEIGRFNLSFPSEQISLLAASTNGETLVITFHEQPDQSPADSEFRDFRTDDLRTFAYSLTSRSKLFEMSSALPNLAKVAGAFDRGRVAVLSNRALRVIDEDGRAATLSGSDDVKMAVAAPRAGRVATLDSAGHGSVIDISAGKRLADTQFDENIEYSISLSPDGRTIVAVQSKYNENSSSDVKSRLTIWEPDKNSSKKVEIPAQVGGVDLKGMGFLKNCNYHNFTTTEIWTPQIGFDPDRPIARIILSQNSHASLNSMAILDIDLGKALLDLKSAKIINAQTIVKQLRPHEDYNFCQYKLIVNNNKIRALHMNSVYFGDTDYAPTPMALFDLDKVELTKRYWAHPCQMAHFTLNSSRNQAVTACDDGLVRLIDLESGQVIRTMTGHIGAVTSVTYSLDESRIISSGDDGTLRLWDTATGTILATVFLGVGNDVVILTPEGFFSGTPEAAKSLSVIKGLQALSIDQVFDQLYRPDLVREKLAGDPKGLVKAAAAKINLDMAIGSGAPPAVKVVGAPTNVAAESVRLEVEATDQGGGIGKVEWRVNGVVTGLGNRGLARTDPVPALAGGASSESPSGTAPATSSPPPTPSPKTLRLTQDVTLVPGENTIEVVAYNAAGLVASRPEAVKITSTASVAKGPGKLFVLAVGVNDYFDSRLALNYAVPDAKAIVDGFQTAKGDVYGAVETKLVTDAEVTPEKLEAVLSEIGAKAKPQDTFVLFVAGHGKTVDGRYYYLPRDFRYRDETSFASAGIGQTLFQDWLSRVKAQRSVLLFDTCESGSLTEDRPALRGVERAVAMEKMTAAMGRTTIAAASDDKPALEGYKGHGVFTYAILSGLSAADRNGDGRVDVLELIQYLDQEVPDLSDRAFKLRQIPQTKFSGNNFALAAKTTIVPNAPKAATSSTAMPSKPTHVLITPAEVFTAAGSGATVGWLESGTHVGVVKTEAGWVLIARDGKPFGYVKEAQLLRLQ